MHFNWEINVGQIASVAIILATFYKFHISNVKRFMKIELQVGQMWHVFKRRFGVGSDDIFGGDHNEDE